MEEESDEFFDVTVNDVRYMLTELRQRQADGDSGMLMTRQMRELADDRKAMRYAQVVVRVAGFRGTSLVLQGLFRPKESVAALYSFVRECLAADGSNTADDLDFQLFVTPPRFAFSA